MILAFVGIGHYRGHCVSQTHLVFLKYFLLGFEQFNEIGIDKYFIPTQCNIYSKEASTNCIRAQLGAVLCEKIINHLINENAHRAFNIAYNLMLLIWAFLLMLFFM